MAVTTTVAAVVGGTVTAAVNDPLALVVKGMLADPAVRVPDAWRAKPAPVTVMEDPAGPAEALSVIPARLAASAGVTMPNSTASDRTRPVTTN